MKIATWGHSALGGIIARIFPQQPSCCCANVFLVVELISHCLRAFAVDAVLQQPIDMKMCSKGASRVYSRIFG